jgi:hypothetical protein
MKVYGDVKLFGGENQDLDKETEEILERRKLEKAQETTEDHNDNMDDDEYFEDEPLEEFESEDTQDDIWMVMKIESNGTVEKSNRVFQHTPNSKLCADFDFESNLNFLDAI